MRIDNLESMPWKAKNIRYIKLGSGGKYWSYCREKNILILGFDSGRPQVRKLMEKEDWDGVEEYWKDKCKTAKAHTNAMRQFQEDDGATLWVTFADGRLQYAFTSGNVQNFRLNEKPDFNEDTTRLSYRRLWPKGWVSVDKNEEALSKMRLSTALTKTEGFRGTICKFSLEMESYLRLKLKGERSPDVTATIKARHDLSLRLSDLIKHLNWWDFELLIDLIFSNSGWIKTSSVGGVQKYLDLEVFNKISDLKACIQIKTATNESQFKEYTRARLDEAQDYDYIYYIYHTSDRNLTKIKCDKKIITWDLRRVSEEAIKAGLIDWVIDKRS